MADIKPTTGPLPGSDKNITLFLGGDVMTGRGIDQVLPNPGDPTIHEHYVKSALGYVDLAEEINGPIPRPVDFRYIWGDTLGILEERNPDLRIINLETSITTSDDYWPRKGINYRMHPGNTPVLSAAGIDCCVLANNHVLDWGYKGLRETLATLQKARLGTTGAGLDLDHASTPAVFGLAGKGRVILFSVASETSGVRSTWAAAPDRPGVNFLTDFSAATVERIADQVRLLKQTGDIVVVSIHWGSNWGYDVPDEQREFAQQLVDRAHVDIIHGHSSHHPRGIEIYQNKPIIYGCGDFINDYEGISSHKGYRGDLSLVYFLEMDPARGFLTGLEMVPHQMRKFRLNQASKQDVAWLGNTLRRASRPFNTQVELSGDGRRLHITL